MDTQVYRAPNCFRTRLHVAAKQSCPRCEYNESCPFGFNINQRPLVNEIRVDFAGNGSCNLDCRLCWAKTWDSAVSGFTVLGIVEALGCCLKRLSESMCSLSEAGRIRKPEYFSFSDFQITGGEPMVNRARAEHVIGILLGLDSLLQSHASYLNLFKRRKTGQFVGRARARLFTNGVAIGKGLVDLSTLKEFSSLKSVHVDVMVSLKGTNEKEFSSLQDKDWHPTEGNHHHQVEAVSVLKKLEQEIGDESLSVNLVLGMYHSDSYDIVCNDTTEAPSFSEWSRDLKHMVRQFFPDGKSIFVEPVKNPYRARDQHQEALWVQSMGSLLRTPGSFEPTLKEGRGRGIAQTRVARTAFARAVGGT